jgi:hypothetical protein
VASSHFRALLAVSLHAEWERWLRFFLECPIEAAELALRQVQGLATLREAWGATFLAVIGGPRGLRRAPGGRAVRSPLAGAAVRVRGRAWRQRRLVQLRGQGPR